MGSTRAENPFMLLGLPQTMSLTLEQVESAALRLSARLHPDAAGGDPEAEARLAAVNQARTTLASKETRAIALLEAMGGPAAGADRSLPDGFLMEMMQARESMDEAVAAGKAHELARWRRWAMDRRDQHADRVADLFASAGGQPALRRIRQELNAWRYIERMLEQIPVEFSGPGSTLGAADRST